MSKNVSTLLKIAVTLAGLVYVVTQVPVADIANEFATLRWSWLILGLVVYLLGLIIRAFRWFLLLRGLGVTPRFERLVELYFVGTFFNAFLPSGFGGDVVRALEVAQDVPADVAAGTVIVDRLSGLLMLFAMALVALPFRPSGFPEQLLWQLTAVSMLGLVGGFVLLEGRLVRRLGAWLPGRLSVVDEQQPLARLLSAVQGCGWPAIIQALLASVVLNLTQVGLWRATGLALGQDISFTYLLLVTPILAVALLVPSFSGLGVRETLAPLLFAAAGLSGAESVSLSLLIFVIMRVSGLFGAPIYILSLLRRRGDNDRADIGPGTAGPGQF